MVLMETLGWSHDAVHGADGADGADAGEQHNIYFQFILLLLFFVTLSLAM